MYKRQPFDRVKDIEDVRTRGEQLGRYNTFIHVFSRMLPEDYKAEKKKWSFKEALVYRKNRVIGPFPNSSGGTGGKTDQFRYSRNVYR